MLPWVSAQYAARVLDRAIELRDAGNLEGAREALSEGIANVKAYGSETLTADALRLLDEGKATVAEAEEYAVKRKMMKYSSSAMKRMRSSEHWVGESAAPSFIKPTPPPTSPAPPPDAQESGNPKQA